jgi:hypothetical protein
LKRYFMSQICWEIDAIGVMGSIPKLLPGDRYQINDSIKVHEMFPVFIHQGLF